MEEPASDLQTVSPRCDRLQPLLGQGVVERHLRRVDEYQRLIQLEALAAGFGVAMVTSLTIGFVGVGGTATRFSGWIVYSAGMATWAIAAIVNGRDR